jgi:phosphomannomutase
LKLKSGDGGTLDPAETDRLVGQVPIDDPRSPTPGEVPVQPSFLPSYLRALKERTALRAIRTSGLSIVADAMHGMGGTLIEKFLSGGTARAQTLRARPDPLFGGASPEPLARNLVALRRAVVGGKADAGFATDGDADRMAAVDEKGRFLSPLTLLPLLALHLIESRGERGGIARTFAGSLRMERIARRHQLPFYDLPVGFKHVANLLRRGEILLGGEESGGFGFRGFIPERDGTLSSLLLLEAMVLAGQPLSRLVDRMEKEYGKYSYDRVDLPVAPEAGRRMTDAIAGAPPRRIAGFNVTDVNCLDGVKLIFGEDGWLLFRASGTEPVLRLYCEAPTAAGVAAVLRAAVRRVGR